MKVQLIVVQGKPEGKVIPLSVPKFKIGRGETCHLRPASEQVSREHAEFSIEGETVSVRDLGSRNGTLVNGKVIKASTSLKDRDLVQVGPLTFAVSIQGATVGARPAPSGRPGPDDVEADDIDAWLVGDSQNPPPERPSAVYSGETITINAFRDASTPKPPAAAAAATPAPAPAPPEPPADEAIDEQYERQADEDVEDENENEDDEETESEADEAAAPEEFVDESNPFYVKKKKEPEGPSKPVYKDTSDAASDILRKMMERRRGGAR